MNNVRILMLEDSPIDAELVLANLSEDGIVADAVRVDTREGFERALDDRTLDLILADHRLPAFDGVSALRLARARRPEVPFIFVSGTMGEELAVEAMRDGATDYVLKHRMGRLSPSVRRAMHLVRERGRREAAEEAARRDEEVLRLVIDGVKDYAIFMLDPDGLIASWNEGAQRITGWRADEVLGRHCRLLYAPEDRSRGWPERNLREAGERGHFAEQHTRARKDGTAYDADVVIHPVHDGRGKPRGYSTVLRDVTERRRAEAERCRLLEQEQAARREAERAREEAESANRAKDDFLATVSHELRTPLTAMLGWARLLRGESVDAATLAEGLETIERNARAQAQLIEDILDLSRIVTGRLRLNVRQADLGPVVHEALDTVRPAADAKGIRLNVALGGPAVVSADPDRLQQVVWNLLSNAIKFTPAGGEVNVSVEREPGEHGRVCVTVSDTGRGIAPEFLPHVFDRFLQADASSTRRYGGLGLGLAICRHLVELHGGTIEARSEGEGKGATFRFALPLMSPRPEPPARRPAVATVPGGAAAADGSSAPDDTVFPRFQCPPALSGVRVLVVDDEPDARRLVATVLERCDARVLSAGGAAEALALLEREPPDVLVSDISMPDEDGYSLMRKVRQREQQDAAGPYPDGHAPSAAPSSPSAPVLPAIALTAYARPEDRRRALSAGFQAYLPKPVEPSELVSAVARLAGRDPEAESPETESPGAGGVAGVAGR